LLDSVAAAGVDIARVTSFASMALHPETGATRLVQVRAPEPGFPFYGTIETQPAGQWATLHQGRNLVVDPALLIALGAEIGDSVSIGATRFRITGALERMPGDVEVASFAPRVFIPAAHSRRRSCSASARASTTKRSCASPTRGWRTRSSRQPEVWRAERVRARTLEDQQRSMEEALGRLSDFLGLTGVFALLLGGIGVASAMGAYMARKADGGRGAALPRRHRAPGVRDLSDPGRRDGAGGCDGRRRARRSGAVDPPAHARGPPSGRRPDPARRRRRGDGMFVGVWTAVAFALLPLLQVRTVAPLSALRRRVEPIRIAAGDPVRIAAWVGLAAASPPVMYQAGSPSSASWSPSIAAPCSSSGSPPAG
jgi:putative ABC transport system permease protein